MRTQVEQLQVEASEAYNDGMDLTTRNFAESSVYNTDVMDNLDYLRTMVKEIKGETDWYTAPDENINDLAARSKLENKLMLWRTQVMTDISVTSAQNYEALGATEIPTANIAISLSNKGGVTSQLVGAIGSNALTEIAGLNGLNPKNLCKIVIWIAFQ